MRTLSDGRSGLFSFRSYSLDRYDIVRDKLKREPVAISARLDLPELAADRTKVPAAILLHGSDGLTKLQTRYARALLERGVATLAIDSFSGRGINSTIGKQNSLAADAMVVDAYAALGLLSTHPRIDAESIAVIGWSKGGIASLWSARKSFRRRLAKDSQHFAAHVAFYPWCGEQEADITLTGAPVLVLSGELDDWSGARPCIDYVAQAKHAGYDARIVVYEDAHHGFDYEGSFHTFLPRAVNWSECVYFARETGFVVATSGWFSAWPDLNRYLRRCSSQGAHVASNSRARKRVRSDLFSFLSAVLMSRG
ncbi:MAG: dienelactone hydrolase family protein [Woeseiaceae bacterium]